MLLLYPPQLNPLAPAPHCRDFCCSWCSCGCLRRRGLCLSPGSNLTKGARTRGQRVGKGGTQEAEKGLQGTASHVSLPRSSGGHVCVRSEYSPDEGREYSSLEDVEAWSCAMSASLECLWIPSRYTSVRVQKHGELCGHTPARKRSGTVHGKAVY